MVHKIVYRVSLEEYARAGRARSSPIRLIDLKHFDSPEPEGWLGGLVSQTPNRSRKPTSNKFELESLTAGGEGHEESAGREDTPFSPFISLGFKPETGRPRSSFNCGESP